MLWRHYTTPEAKSQIIASVDAGFAEHVDYRRIRAMARALATSFTRRDYYLEFLQERRKGILEDKDYKLPSFHELELQPKND